MSTLTGGALAQADPAPAAPPSALERAAEHPAYAKVFADVPDEVDLEPLLEAVRRTIGSAEDAVEALRAIAEIVLADVSGFAEGLPELLEDLQDDPAGAVEVLQAALLAQQADLLLAGLPAVLDLLSAIVAPSCYTLGALSAALPAQTGVLPINAELFGPLAPAVEQLDRGVSDAVYNLYVDLFAQLLGGGPELPEVPELPAELPVPAPTGLLTVAQTLLSIFKVDVDTTYYSEGADPVTRSHPGLLNLPVLLDVDQRTGIDLCALTTLDLGSLVDPEGLTALELGQTVGRVPLRNKALSVDLNAKALFGALQFGFATKDTVVPTIVESTADLSLAGLASTYLQGAIDTTLTQPGDTFAQTLNLAGAAGNRVSVVDPPSSYRAEVALAGGEGGNGLQYTYSGAQQAETFAFEQFLGTLTQGVKHTPAATDLSYCGSLRGFCSNQPGVDPAAGTHSVHLRASEIVRVEEKSIAPTACSLLGGLVRVACGQADVTAQQFNLGAKIPTAASTAGYAWVDTNDSEVVGSIQTPLLGIVAALPAGFKAQDRLATWTGTGTAPADSKFGTVTCPTNTSVFTLANTALVGGFGLNRYFCSIPPVNITSGFGASIPTISPSAPTATTTILTANPRTWTGAPNAPTFSYQWQRCATADTTTCVDIVGASGPSTMYTIQPADRASRIRVKVTGTNLDGTGIAFSNPTGVVPGTPPPPAVTGLSEAPAAGPLMLF
ncbi:MAG: hypothetical protein ACT4P1_12825 [Sporichthyaceae bacterium]